MEIVLDGPDERSKRYEDLVMQNSQPFHQGMVNRMLHGMHKYGRVADSDTDWIETLKLRLQEYLETGNTEFLMDVANFAMCEYMHPRLVGAFFRATESNESPGLITGTGVNIKDRLPKTFHTREGD